jgi:hypothetical protein
MMHRAKATLVSVLVLAVSFLGASPATVASAAGSGLPAAPTNVVASANPGSAKVTWNPPADDGGAAITGYVVTPYKAGVTQPARAFASTKLFQRITGLTNNAQYTFTVAAANANGIGLSSVPMTAITVGFRRAPTAPTALSTVPGNGQVVLTWAAPSSSGSASVTRYLVTPYLDGAAGQVRAYDAGTTQIVTGLTNGSTYRFTVIAESAAGKSPPSAMSGPVTVGTVRPNTAPVATADVFTAYEDTPMEVAAPGILANDTDADDDPLQIEVVTYPGGFVDVRPDGSFSYEPYVNSDGDDFFTYRVSDGIAWSAPVLVRIDVIAVNDPPNVEGEQYETPYETTLDVGAPGVLANDSDPIEFDGLSASGPISGPAHGTVVLRSDGSFTYTPDPGYSGFDGFAYLVSDSQPGGIGNVEITVGDPPVEG